MVLINFLHDLDLLFLELLELLFSLFLLVLHISDGLRLLQVDAG